MLSMKGRSSAECSVCEAIETGLQITRHFTGYNLSNMKKYKCKLLRKDKSKIL